MGFCEVFVGGLFFEFGNGRVDGWRFRYTKLKDRKLQKGVSLKFERLFDWGI